jgi:hypothetical protein
MANLSRKAARARLNEALAKHLIDDFTEHGAEVIAKLRKNKPADYLKMVTTAFQSEDPPAVPRALDDHSKSRPGTRAEFAASEREHWLTDPAMDEIVQLTSSWPVHI